MRWDTTKQIKVNDIVIVYDLLDKNPLLMNKMFYITNSLGELDLDEVLNILELNNLFDSKNLDSNNKKKEIRGNIDYL